MEVNDKSSLSNQDASPFPGPPRRHASSYADLAVHEAAVARLGANLSADWSPRIILSPLKEKRSPRPDVPLRDLSSATDTDSPLLSHSGTLRGKAFEHLALGQFSPQEAAVLSHVLHNFKHQSLGPDHIFQEILKGAYVILEDEGKTYSIWAKEFSSSIKETPSSHASGSPQYSFTGPLVKAFLFSDGKERPYTWFQAERYPAVTESPLQTARYFGPHIACWAEYRRTGENQGPWGSTPYREANPLVLQPVERAAPSKVEFD